MKQTILLTEFFPPYHGGIEDSLERLLPVLGSNVLVVTPPSPGCESYDRSQSHATLRRSLFSGRLRPRWSWLVSWLWQRRGEISLVLYGHFSMATAAAWLLRPLGVHYAVFVHGNDLFSELRGWRRPLVQLILRRADWVGINSEFTGQAVHRLGVPLVKLIKLYPMVPDDLLQLSNTADGLRLITVSRLVKRKNIALILEAVAKLVTEFPKLQYDLVGDGPERANLETQASKLQIRQQLNFHGLVSESEKRKLLQAATIAVMTPESNGANVEGLGLFYLEASAVGLPVVTTKSGGASEAVIDQETGTVLTKPTVEALTVALRRLLQDPSKRSAFGQAGRDHVAREFTVSIRTQRFARLRQAEQQPRPPLVSVIIPVWQDASSIGRTLEDLLKQTWPNCEIIVVDDGSTDSLEQSLRPYIDRIQFYRQANQGAPVARNLGASKARGEFLLFVDADARLNPELITKMVVALQTHPEASYAYSSFRFGPKLFRLFEFSPERLRQMNFIHTTSLLRRTDFPGFDPALKKFQDWDLWLTMLEQGHQGIWLPQELFQIEQRAGKMSNWLPKFAYQLPGLGQGRGSQTIARYRAAETIIRKKHRI